LYNKETKNYRKLERIVKGFSNHRRVEILDLINRKPELSLADISDEPKINFKTASDHIRRLAIAELVMKRSEGPSVCHKITPVGSSILMFLRTLE